VSHDLDEEAKKEVVRISEGFSCADMQMMIKEAAMHPIRELPPDQILKIKDTSSIRKLSVDDFKKAVSSQPPSVSKHSIKEFDDWRKEKG